MLIKYCDVPIKNDLERNYKYSNLRELYLKNIAKVFIALLEKDH